MQMVKIKIEAVREKKALTTKTTQIIEEKQDNDFLKPFAVIIAKQLLKE